MLLSDEEIEAVNFVDLKRPYYEVFKVDQCSVMKFARAIEAAILAKLASAELPSAVWVDVPHFTYTAAQLHEAHAQGFAAGAASQLSAEPVAHLRKNGFRFLGDFEPQDDSELPLYTRREA